MSNVLIIEKHDYLCNLWGGVLDRFNHDGAVVRDAKGGLELLEIMRPDLVICHIPRPGKEDKNFLEYLKGFFKEVPVIGIGDYDENLTSFFDGFFNLYPRNDNGKFRVFSLEDMHDYIEHYSKKR